MGSKDSKWEAYTATIGYNIPAAEQVNMYDHVYNKYNYNAQVI